MRKYFKTTIFITVLLTLLVVFVIGVLKKNNPNSENATVVRLEKVQRGELIELISAPGEIQPKSKVSISAKVSARVIEMPYEEGDRVTRGNPSADPPVPASILIRLDSKDMESRLRSAEANYMAQAAQLEVEKARISSQEAQCKGTDASLKQAQRDLERQKKLFQSSDISQSVFDQTQLRAEELTSQHDSAEHNLKAAKLNLVVMEHNLQAAQAQIDQAKESLSYTIIESPMDGIITRINAKVGEMVMYGTMNNPGTVIMEVADLSQMLFVAQVDETDVGKLKQDSNAEVRVQAYPDTRFKGIVDTIALSHDISRNGSKYFKTEIMLKADGQQLYSGLTGDVDIETKKHENVIKIPTQAVMGTPVDSLPLDIRDNCPEVNKDKTFAIVVYRHIDGKTVITPVKIGTSDLTHTIVLSGLSEEDTIVVGPYKVLESIKHDMKIKDEKEAEKEKDNKEKSDSKKTG